MVKTVRHMLGRAMLYQKIGSTFSLAGIILFVMLPTFNVFAQPLTQKISIELKDVTVLDALIEINKHSNSQVMFKTEEVKKENKKVTLSSSNMTVAEAVAACLESTNLTFSVRGDEIIISRKAENQTQSTNEKQLVTYTGKIIDRNGDVLIGATLQVKGETRGTATDTEGNFTLAAFEGSVFIVSFIGYETKEVSVGKQTTINITLEESSYEMGEVTISTGYQVITREKVTGAVSTVTSSELSERYTPNLLDNLEGRVAGLTSYDGKTTIRGTSSLNVATDPLLVVDGLPIESSIEDLNPYDVESITVLKDAAATAIYGARASNGVIVVTTKRAKEIGKTSIDVSANFTIYQKRNLDYKKNFYMTPEQQVEKEADYYKYYFFDGVVTNPIPSTERSLEQGYVSPVHYTYYQYAIGEITELELNEKLDELKKNNFAKEYQKYALKNRFIQQYNIALRSRSENFQSNFVVNFRHDNSGIIHAYDKHFNISYKGNYNATSWLDVGFGINTVHANSKFSNSTYANNPYNVPAYYSVKDSIGFNYYTTYEYNIYNTMPEDISALRSMKFNHVDELSYDQTKTDRLNVRYNGELLIRIIDGLSVTSQFVYEQEKYTENSYSEAESYIMRLMRNVYTVRSGDDPDYTYSYLIPENGGKLATKTTKGDYWTVRGQVNFNRSFNKHSIDFLAGLELRQTMNKGTQNLLLGYDEELQSHATTTVSYPELYDYVFAPFFPSATFSARDYIYNQYIYNAIAPIKEEFHRYGSGYANITYTYNYKYNAFASFRKDYADVYGLDSKYRGKPLWSIGGSWNIHQEDFLYNENLINFLKLRASYGITGNIYHGATSYMTADASLFNTITQQPYAVIESPANPELKWEQTETFNVGIDFSLLDNRVRGSFDWYHKKGKDIFSEKLLDPSKGFATMAMNMASLKNDGIEIALNVDWFKPMNTTGFFWKTTLTSAYNKNKVTKVDIIAKSAGALIENGLQVGYPVSALFSYRFAKIENGDYTWYNSDDEIVNGRKIDESIENAVYSGQSDPKINMGMDNRFSYKGISLNVMMVYYGGHKMRVLQASPILGGVPQGAFASYYLNSWTPENQDTNVPGFGQYAVGDYSYHYFNTDIYVQPADFIKIRNIVLGYDLPNNILGKIGMKNLSLRFQIDNPKTLWKKNKVHVDPETKGVRKETSYVIGLNFNI